MRTTNQTFFIHHRTRDVNNNVHNHGGHTVAFRTIGGNIVEYAVARCHENENFNKRLGRTIASGRLGRGRGTTIVAIDYTELTPGEVARLIDQRVAADLNCG